MYKKFPILNDQEWLYEKRERISGRFYTELSQTDKRKDGKIYGKNRLRAKENTRSSGR